MWILIALVLVAVLIQHYTFKYALEDLHYNSEISKLLCAPDEIFEFITTVNNNSWRFVPYIRMRESISDAAIVHMEGAHLEEYRFMKETWHISKLFLMPRSGVVLKLPISFPKRGRYIFSGGEIKSGDFLGLKEKSMTIPHKREVVIYPKPADYNYTIKQIGGFLGDISVRRFIIEDPILTAGFSDYTGREPMKSISWSQSAKSGRMMIKTYDHTAELNVSLVLNLEGSEEEIEKSLSLCHTVCHILEKKRIKYEFYSNIVPNGSSASWVFVAEGLGERHFRFILEGLGRASYDVREPLEKLLDRVPKERGIILVSHGKVEEII